MIEVTFFSKPDCRLCHGARYVVTRVQSDIPFQLVDIDISAPGNEAWMKEYGEHIPVVHLNGAEIFRHRVDEKRFRRILNDQRT